MCAEEQGKFWEFHDGIFALNGRLDASSFLAIGADLDLDPGALEECLKERRYEKVRSGGSFGWASGGRDGNTGVLCEWDRDEGCPRCR